MNVWLPENKVIMGIVMANNQLDKQIHLSQLVYEKERVSAWKVFSKNEILPVEENILLVAKKISLWKSKFRAYQRNKSSTNSQQYPVCISFFSILK